MEALMASPVQLFTCIALIITVLSLFVKAVQSYGLLERVRSDPSWGKSLTSGDTWCNSVAPMQL